MPMKKGLLQEKFQVTSQRPKGDSNSWTSFESARKVGTVSTEYLNCLPPGMDITNQENTRQNAMKLGLAGSTDETNAVSSSNANKGWIKRDMSPVDDMYTNEHVEEFYGEASGDDDGGDKITGFLERNNYLDRN